MKKSQATTELVPTPPPSPQPGVSAPSEALVLTDLLKDGRHFAEHRGEHTHIIDSITGVSVAVLAKDPQTALSSRLIREESPTGVVTWVQEGVKLPTIRGSTAYNPLVLDLICQKIAEGASLTEVCKEPGMPSYNSVCAWKRKHPEVQLALDSARRDRAEAMRDKILAKAEEVMVDEQGGRASVAALGVLLEATKWSAAVDNEKYNPKSKVEASISVPTIIQVNTGIER